MNGVNANDSQQKTHFSFTLSDPEVDGLRRDEFDIEFLLPGDGDLRGTVGDGGGSNIGVVKKRGEASKMRNIAIDSYGTEEEVSRLSGATETMGFSTRYYQCSVLSWRRL